jgi:hypothetical protein
MRRPAPTNPRRTLSRRRTGAIAFGLGFGPGLAASVTATAAPKSPFPRTDAHIQGGDAATQPLRVAPAHLAGSPLELCAERLDGSGRPTSETRHLVVQCKARTCHVGTRVAIK